MNTKPILLLTTAALVAGLALAQGHQFQSFAPRGAMMGRAQAQAAAPQHLNQVRFQAFMGPQLDLGGVVAGALGLTQDELTAAKQGGASIAQIAEEAGIPLADVEAAYLVARTEAIGALLTDGAITEVQAEQMTTRGTEAFAALVAREGCEDGRNAGGEPLYQNRVATARGPQDVRMQARQAPRGPGARW